jgi:hypothetical protein
MAVCAVTAPAEVLADEGRNVARECYGVDVNFGFIADRYKEAWLSNSAAPFNFANLFDFDLPDKDRGKVAYARMESKARNASLSFFSASSELVFHTTLSNSSLQCSSERAVVNYSYSVHGADSFGGSNRRVTVTFLPKDNVVRASSKVELDSRWLIFRSSTQTREIWAEFSRYVGHAARPLQ